MLYYILQPTGGSEADLPLPELPEAVGLQARLSLLDVILISFLFDDIGLPLALIEQATLQAVFLYRPMLPAHQIFIRAVTVL